MNQTPTAVESFYMHRIKNNGVDLPKRPIIDFISGSATDDPVNNKTLVTLGGVIANVANLTAGFIQPAVTGSPPISVQVNSSSGLSVGVEVFIQGGGFYQVVGIPDGTHLSLVNSGGPNNVSPGTTVSSGALVIPSGSPPLLIQSNDADVIQRQRLDFRGFTYADDATNGRMIITAPTALGAPGATVTNTGYVVQPGDRWKLFDATGGPVPFTLPGPTNETAATIGLTREFTHVAGPGTGGEVVSFNGNGAQVRKFDGTLALANIAVGKTPAITYRLRWDGSIYQCVN